MLLSFEFSEIEAETERHPSLIFLFDSILCSFIGPSLKFILMSLAGYLSFDPLLAKKLLAFDLLEPLEPLWSSWVLLVTGGLEAGGCWLVSLFILCLFLVFILGIWLLLCLFPGCRCSSGGSGVTPDAPSVIFPSSFSLCWRMEILGMELPPYSDLLFIISDGGVPSIRRASQSCLWRLDGQLLSSWYLNDGDLPWWCISICFTMAKLVSPESRAWWCSRDLSHQVLWDSPK